MVITCCLQSDTFSNAFGVCVFHWYPNLEIGVYLEILIPISVLNKKVKIHVFQYLY